MKKEQIKGWVSFGIVLLIQLYIGAVYRLGAFSLSYAFALACAMLAIPVLVLYGYRRLGSLPAWLVTAAALPLLYYSAKDVATTVLTWALCFGTPLAVSLCWPHCRAIRPTAMVALPVAGGLWLGGALLYCKLHFGGWALYAMTEQIAARYAAMVEKLHEIYLQAYNGALPEQMQKIFIAMQGQAASMGFYLITMAVYGLVGAFFISVLLADKSLPAEARWLGSWAALIPAPGISWVYMTLYLLVLFFADQNYQTFAAVLDLFGFFFVFTALYRLMQLFRRKGMQAVWRWLLISLMLVLAYFSVGGAMLSPYMVLMYLGWWIATTPKWIRQIKR